MNIIKRVLGHIFFVYALLLFVATMLIVVMPIWLTSFMKEPQRSKWLHGIFRVWMGVYMPLAGCPVIRRGKEKFQPGQSYVVVTNHNSFVDIPVSSPWIPGPNKTLAKIEMARIPIFGLIYTAGSILVDRKSDQSRRESFAKMQATLDMGLHLCLYPEGTRNKTKQPIQTFYDGAFKTAIRAQHPIMPAVIFNTGRILPHNVPAWAWPMPVHFDFLDPIPTKGLALSDTAELKARVHQLMTDYYVANRDKK
ncbi:MAG: 1-acyl-sn-glycerol-3-phosphate acyltransferase [Sphingobacteriales bacterium]|nr:MAG: 1-acyl-sn-glycerol-3-phosphate acyltransferase [Sphingobacteriales bacterium]